MPGVKSSNGDQAKLLKRLVAKMFERSFLANFTWSGKSINGQRKIALKSHDKIVELLYKISNNCLNKTYNYEDFLNHLKNKILKYAYE